jgi:acyl-coenzyme A synthetase/AMP-(fatty) acid ligase
VYAYIRIDQADSLLPARLGTATVHGWASLVAQVNPNAVADFVCVDTAAEDPALIIYTSGTTGKAKVRV